MPERVQKQKPEPQKREAEEVHSEGGEQADLTETDELLDEIDEILEENAEEFVRDYIQRGGE